MLLSVLICACHSLVRTPLHKIDLTVIEKCNSKGQYTVGKWICLQFARIKMFTIDVILNKFNDLWSWKLIQKTELPTKVICFNLDYSNWVMFNTRHPHRKGFQQSTSWRVSVASFLHCSVATELQNMFYCIFGLNWVMPHHMRETYKRRSSQRVEKPIKNI